MNNTIKKAKTMIKRLRSRRSYNYKDLEIAKLLEDLVKIIEKGGKK